MRSLHYLLVAVSIMVYAHSTSRGEDLKGGREERSYPQSGSDLVESCIELREYERARSLIEDSDQDLRDDAVVGRMYLVLGDWQRALRFLEEIGDPFQIGYCYEKLEQFDQGISWYEKAWEQDSLLKDYYLLRKGTCKLLRGDREGAIKDLTELAEDFASSPLAPQSYEEMARCFEELGKTNKANWLRRLVARRWPGKRMEMEYSTGLSLETEGKAVEASRAYYGLVKRFPDSPFSLKALERLRALTELASEDLFYSGRLLYYQRQYQEAAGDLEGYIEAHPEGMYAKHAHYFLGKAFYNLGEYQEALDQFGTVAKRYRKDPISLKAQFNLARCQERLGQDELAIISYERLAERFPKSYLTDDALYGLGRYYETRGDLEEALAVYERVVQEVPPQGDYWDDALLRAGLTHTAMGQPDSATTHLKALLARKTSLQEPASYWLARCLEERGNREEAQNLYRALASTNPVSFYALASAERISPNGEDHSLLCLSEQDPEDWVEKWQPSPLSQEQVLRLRRGERLLRLGFLEEGSAELARVRSQDPLSLYRISTVLSKYGCDSESIRYGSRLYWMALTKGESSYPRKLIQILYPTPYSISVKERSMEFGLDPSLLFALIREESLFDPKAVSSAGAIGLTQVIPRTGRRIADELGHPDFGAGDLHNPGKSIQYGSFYLSQLVEEFEGRIDLALAAYNAGPHNVKRWIGGDSDPEREWFVESIPFWETRAYVKRVLSSLWVYSFLYQTRGD